MIIKVVTLFLIGIVILAIFGRIKLPKVKLGLAKKCKKCGAPLINNANCICEE